MNFRFDFKGYHFHIGLSKSAQVKGALSLLENGKHILMWDFDNVGEDDVKKSLLMVQKHFKLPKVYIISTGIPFHFHAYSFKSCFWPDTLHILAHTEYLDTVYFKIGVIRGYFTLRYTPKKSREFTPAVILPSNRREDLDPLNLPFQAPYWTKRL